VARRVIILILMTLLCEATFLILRDVRAYLKPPSSIRARTSLVSLESELTFPPARDSIMASRTCSSLGIL
jgi:hypothetical protein